MSKFGSFPKFGGIISRILEATTIALYTIFGSTFLGSPYCGKLPFRELFEIYQDSGKENEITNSRLRVFSVMCNAGSALHWIFSCNSTENHVNYITKKADFKNSFLENPLCCKNAPFCSTFCFAAMRDDVKNACIEKRTRTPKHCMRQ